MRVDSSNCSANFRLGTLASSLNFSQSVAKTVIPSAAKQSEESLYLSFVSHKNLPHFACFHVAGEKSRLAFGFRWRALVGTCFSHSEEARKRRNSLSVIILAKS